MNLNNININWHGHDSFRITTQNKTIYIDPFNLQTTKQADYIFITHEHFDHCSIDDIKKITTAETTIIIIPECQSKISKLHFKKLILVEPNKQYKIDNIEFKTLPAYNTNKFRSPNVQYHPQQDNQVGYVITIDGKQIYHAGDTDATPEMLALKNITIALVPVSGTYTMTPEEAAQAVDTFKPEIAIPMHYASIIGTISDAQKFKQLTKTKVEILEKTHE